MKFDTTPPAGRRLFAMLQTVRCRGWFCIVLALCLGATVASSAPDLPGYYSEPFRPQFHFTPEKNWMNDPNGLVYYEGEYHRGAALIFERSKISRLTALWIAGVRASS